MNMSTWAWRAALALLAVSTLLWLLGPVLVPFAVSAVLAYILYAPVQRLVAWRWPRLLAVLVVEVLGILALWSLLLLVIPVIAHELPQLREQVPLLAARLNEALSPWLQRWGLALQLNPASVKAWVVELFGANSDDVWNAVTASVRIGGSVALAVVGNAILIPVVVFYLLMDAQRWAQRVDALVPLPWRSAWRELVGECDEVLGHYLRGQLLVMGALAVFYVAALWMVGLDLAWPVGLFTGLAVFVPYVGFGLGCVLALLAALLQFGAAWPVLAVAGVYAAGQLLESLVLTPRWVGERIGLGPLTVLFALLAFGHVMGFVGVLVALPASAVLAVGGQRLWRRYQASRFYQGPLA